MEGMVISVKYTVEFEIDCSFKLIQGPRIFWVRLVVCYFATYTSLWLWPLSSWLPRPGDHVGGVSGRQSGAARAQQAHAPRHDDLPLRVYRAGMPRISTSNIGISESSIV